MTTTSRRRQAPQLNERDAVLVPNLQSRSLARPSRLAFAVCFMLVQKSHRAWRCLFLFKTAVDHLNGSGGFFVAKLI